MSSVLVEQITALWQPPVAVVGVGNDMRGDDAFGPAVVAMLPDRLPVARFDAGMAPENWLGPITRAEPGTVLVVDAAAIDSPPGSLRLLRPDELEGVGVSTHGLPIGFFLGMVAERTGAQVFLLACQPTSLRLGSPMSDVVQAAARRAAAAIAAACGAAWPRPSASCAPPNQHV